MNIVKMTSLFLLIYTFNGCAPESKTETPQSPELGAKIQGFENEIICEAKTFPNSNESFVVSIAKSKESEEYMFASSYYVVDSTNGGYSTSEKALDLIKSKVEKNEEKNILKIYNVSISIEGKNPLVAIYDLDKKILALLKIDGKEPKKILDCNSKTYLLNN